RSDIRNRANRGVVEPSFKTNSPKGGKSMRYADPKPKIVTEQPPFLDHCSNSSSHIERHQHCLERRVFHGDRIVKDHHHAIASKPLKRATVFDDNLSDCRMIVAQERHYVFRVSAFRESGKATQVAEQRSDLPAMTFELLFGPRCHDQVKR